MVTELTIASSPMLVTLPGISILVNPIHSQNAPFPMLVTLPGISILVNPLHQENAESPMLVTPSGIMVVLQPAIKALLSFSIIQFFPFPLVYMVFPESTTILVSPSHPENGFLPMFVTLPGISIPVNPSQYSNAPAPMLVTLPGISIPVSPSHL